MTNQQIIDKYLKEFYEVWQMKVPIELNPYLHRMIDEALLIRSVTRQGNQLQRSTITETDKEYKNLMKSLYPKDNSKRFRK